VVFLGEKEKRPKELEVTSLLGIAVDNPSLYGEFKFCLGQTNFPQPAPLDSHLVPIISTKKQHIKLLAIGWIVALPLMLKRLLDSYQTVQLTLLDEVTPAELKNILAYVNRRISEMDGAAYNPGGST